MTGYRLSHRDSYGPKCQSQRRKEERIWVPEPSRGTPLILCTEKNEYSRSDESRRYPIEVEW